MGFGFHYSNGFFGGNANCFFSCCFSDTFGEFGNLLLNQSKGLSLGVNLELLKLSLVVDHALLFCALFGKFLTLEPQLVVPLDFHHLSISNSNGFFLCHELSFNTGHFGSLFFGDGAG